VIIEEIKGNILNTNITHIAHGVNCQNVMGSGVAKALYTKYPVIKKGYHTLYTELFTETINRTSDFLGIVQPVICSEVRTVFNCFTQNFYGRNGKLYVSYPAIYECFENLVKLADEMNFEEIAIPKIGCGLAGGDWEIVKDIINNVTGDCLDVYVYHL
jgi:O-acetyl-ADP-ribose deacetylase (regulator of RNase III)